MKVFIYHANAGHGHKKVAEVLFDAFKKKGLSGNNLRLEDALDLTPWFFRKSYPAIYYNSVKYSPQSWGKSYEITDKPGIYRWVKPIRYLGNWLVGQKLLKQVIDEKPDWIICTHFLTAQLFSQAKLEGKIQSKIVVVVTDYYPHTFWVNPGTDIYWIMSDEGSEDLQRRGVDANKIIAGGIPIEDKFLPTGEKASLLKQWEMAPNRFTILMTSGSFGFGSQEAMLRAMEPFQDKIQCFVVCARNQVMEKTLKQKNFLFPVKIFGFVDFMVDLMEASDLMIAKAGGSTTTEALAKGIPMIISDLIPGQESRNADLLKARNAAFFVDKPAQIEILLRSIFKNPKILEDKKRQINRLAQPKAAHNLVEYALANS